MAQQCTFPLLFVSLPFSSSCRASQLTFTQLIDLQQHWRQTVPCPFFSVFPGCELSARVISSCRALLVFLILVSPSRRQLRLPTVRSCTVGSLHPPHFLGFVSFLFERVVLLSMRLLCCSRAVYHCAARSALITSFGSCSPACVCPIYRCPSPLVHAPSSLFPCFQYSNACSLPLFFSTLLRCNSCHAY